MDEGVTINARWIAAQVGERAFHCDHMPHWGPHSDPLVRRKRERTMRQWYAGMLEIPLLAGCDGLSVTDYGCGPQSLLLETSGWSRAVAVDPLRFADADEVAYGARGVQRFVTPAERYAGEATDEGWMYNCLQHTQDWAEALRVAVRHTQRTFRLFEWVEVPTDALHLHTLHEPELRSVLTGEGFREVAMVRGEYARGMLMPTPFYAGVWER